MTTPSNRDPRRPLPPRRLRGAARPGTLLVVALIVAVAIGAYWILGRSTPMPEAPGRPDGAPAASTASATPAIAAPADGPGPAGGSGPAADAHVVLDEIHLAKLTRGLDDRGGRVTVVDTPPGSVPGSLGLRAGDVIVSVNGKPLTSAAEFAEIYARTGPPAQMVAMRGTQELHFHH